MSVRICILFDVDTDDLPQAYRTLKETMDRAYGVSGSLFEGWESTDEWYDAKGNPVDSETITKARTAVCEFGGRT